MPDFTTAVAYVLDNEGSAYTDAAMDRGGPTRWGITWRTLAMHRGAPVRPEDVRELQRGEAEAIYRARYWAPLGADTLPSQALATALLDAAVLHGVPTAIELAQEATGVHRDGHLGPVTRKALQANWAQAPGNLLWEFADAWQGHLVHLVGAAPQQMVFLRGWLRRAMHVLTLP